MNTTNLPVENDDPFELAMSWNMAAGSGLLSLAADSGVSDADLLKRIQGSSFYRNTAKPLRDRILLMRNDPATYKLQLELNERNLAQLFIDAGAKITKKRLKKLAKRAFMFNLTPEQLRKIIADSVNFDETYVRGIAGEVLQNVRGVAQSFGIRYDDDSPELIQAVKDVITKQRTLEDVKLQYASEAKRLFPAFSARFDTGATVMDVADPYIEMMASMWEMPKAAIDLGNNFLREALQAVNPKDGAPLALSLTDWRQKLMQAPQFMGTFQAQNMFVNALSNIASRWGLES